MNDIKIKKALGIPLSEHERIKAEWQKIFDEISLITVFRELVNLEKYRGVYLKLS